MSSNLFYDSDDERDDFDIERREINEFQQNLLSASIESSEDDDEGIIDGTKIPSSTKLKTRARYTFLDVSTSSMSNGEQIDDDDDDDGLERNPFEIISKSIQIENNKPIKKKKSLGVPKTRRISDTNDIYEQDEHFSTEDDTKTKVRKPTKAAILETERKMQQLSRSEQLVLPTFVPKPLETWHALEKRSRQELMNEIRAKNPSFTPQDPDLPELPHVETVESTAASTLSDLTKLIEDKPTTSKLDKLSRFLNPDILKKKPTISNINQRSSDMLIDLTDTKKMPTIKPNISISLDCVKSPSSSKKLIEIQKQLGIRMQAKRAAMLADNNPQISRDDEDIDEQSENEKEESDDDDDDDDDDNESMEISEEKASNIEEEEEVDELSTDEEILEDEEEEENLERPTDPDRPSLKTILTRLESSSEPAQIQPPEPVGQTEWFDSARPAQFDSELEMLCSGAFGGDNIVPLSQNIHRQEPVVFSPLPPTQIEDDDIEISRPKVRQLVDDDDDDEEEKDSNEQVNSGSNENEEGEEEEEQDDDENEELIDYKKQLFEMEAEESGSDDEENPKKKADDDDDDSDEDDDEPDEELQKFIDTAAVEMDEDEVDNLAKVHLKIKAKEDEHQLKLLKEQYLDFDGDDDGRRIKLSKNRDEDEDEDDPDYNSENDEDEDDDEDEDENQQTNFANRLSELERQRSIQDTQAEELHLDEDLDNIGQHSSMFQKGLALKQKRIQSTSTTTHIEITTNSNAKKPSRSVTLSSSLLAKRFSSTLLAPMNRINQVSSVSNNNNSNEPTIATKKQHNPRRHVFTTNENQNPAQTSGEKRANSADKSPKTNSKRFKQSTTIITKSKETTTSVFSALAFSNPKP